MFQRENRNLWDNVQLGGIFVFIGGYTGALTSIILGHFVNCMTGNATEVGISTAEFHIPQALLYLVVLLAFIYGAYNSTQILDKRKRGHIRILILEAAALLSVGFLADNHVGIALVLAAFAMGTQNGMTTYVTWTRGKVRTTHVTGTSTDIGVSLATKDYRESGFTIYTALTYTFGVLVGFYVARDFGSTAFLIDAMVLLAIAFMDIVKNSLVQKAII